jgi:hypothetical protein
VYEAFLKALPDIRLIREHFADDVVVFPRPGREHA